MRVQSTSLKITEDKNTGTYRKTDEFGTWTIQYFFTESDCQIWEYGKVRFQEPKYCKNLLNEFDTKKVESIILENKRLPSLYFKIKFMPHEGILNKDLGERLTFIQTVQSKTNGTINDTVDSMTNEPEKRIRAKYRPTPLVIFDPYNKKYAPRMPYDYFTDWKNNGHLHIDRIAQGLVPTYAAVGPDTKTIGDIPKGSRYNRVDGVTMSSTLLDYPSLGGLFVEVNDENRNYIDKLLQEEKMERTDVAIDMSGHKVKTYTISSESYDWFWNNAKSRMSGETYSKFETVAVVIKKNSNEIKMLNSVSWGFHRNNKRSKFVKNLLRFGNPTNEFIRCLVSWNYSTIFPKDSFVKGGGDSPTFDKRIPVFLGDSQRSRIKTCDIPYQEMLNPVFYHKIKEGVKQDVDLFLKQPREDSYSSAFADTDILDNLDDIMDIPDSPQTKQNLKKYDLFLD